MTVYEADWVCPATAEPIRNGAIAVENGRIEKVGAQWEFGGARRVSYPGCAIIPGFVNTHAHLELTILRGFLENVSFAEWILGLTKAKYQTLTRDALKASARLGAIEMLRSGVTALGEVMDVGTSWDAMKEFGLQGVAYQEVFGPEDSVAAESMGRLRTKIDSFRKDETETFRIGVSPHAPYTVSETLYRMTADYARRESLRMTAHIAESRDETLFVREGAGPFGDSHRKRGFDVKPRGCSPLAYLHSLGALGPDMLLIHAIETDEGDIDRIHESGSVVVHCPKSNAKLGHRTAHVADMRQTGIVVALGTDSVASNNVADMFEEMRAAIFYQRTLTGRISALVARDAFRMATIDGARCLGLSSHVGSLDAGKRADFVVVDLGGPATQPVYDPIETMVYSASRADVRATYLAGRAVSIDDSELLEQVGEIAERLRTSG